MTDQFEPENKQTPETKAGDNQTQHDVIDIQIGESGVKVERERTKKRHDRAFFPILLVLVGIILLVQNLGLGLEHFNWWALFVFLPVAGALAGAWSDFRDSGQLNGKVRAAIGSAIVMGTVAVLLLTGANWGHWWPAMLIAAGFSSMLGGIGQWNPAEHKNLSAWSAFNAWTGLGVLVLGVGFLAKFLPIPALAGYVEGWRWWAIPIFIAAFGAFVTAAVVCGRNEWKMNWTAWGFVIIGIVMGIVGFFAYAGLSWNLLAPVILIGVGLVILSRILVKK